MAFNGWQLPQCGSPCKRLLCILIDATGLYASGLSQMKGNARKNSVVVGRFPDAASAALVAAGVECKVHRHSCSEFLSCSDALRRNDNCGVAFDTFYIHWLAPSLQSSPSTREYLAGAVFFRCSALSINQSISLHYNGETNTDY